MVSSKSQIKLPSKKSNVQKGSELRSSKLKVQTNKGIELKTYSLDEVKNKFLGKKGTSKRDEYENELRLDLLGETIRQTRIQRNLTQEQLGLLVGVQKAQISKIENNFKDARISTILKVFDALQTKIVLTVKRH
jgi:HTH-type transcriptional regulator/antitoxin HipB